MLKKLLLRCLLVLFFTTALFHAPISCSFWSNKRNQILIGGFFSIAVGYAIFKYLSRYIQKNKQIKKNNEAWKNIGNKNNVDSDHNNDDNQLTIQYWNLVSLTNFLKDNSVNEANNIEIQLKNIEINEIQKEKGKLTSISKIIDAALSQKLGFKHNGEFFKNEGSIKNLKNYQYVKLMNSQYNQTKIYEKYEKKYVNVSYYINGVRVLEDKNITTDNFQIAVKNKNNSYFQLLDDFLENEKQSGQVLLVGKSS